MVITLNAEDVQKILEREVAKMATQMGLHQPYEEVWASLFDLDMGKLPASLSFAVKKREKKKTRESGKVGDW